MSRLAHKRGRPSNYRKSLQNDSQWEEVKFKVRCRDGHACVCCGKNHGFEVHHVAYSVDGNPIRGKELEFLEWLALVCEGCHQAIHRNPGHPLNPKNNFKININEYKRRYRP